MNLLACLLIFMAVFCTGESFAEERQEDANQVIELEGMTVFATAIHEAEWDSETSHLTLIKGEELEGRFTSITEVLSETVGLQINQFGGVGDFSTISIRGSSSEQVLIYLDGFLLNDAEGGGINIGRIPLSQVEEIKVYRGSASILFGQIGIGGIVSIRTKNAKKTPLATYQTQYGSFNTVRLDTNFSYKPGRSDYMLGLNLTKSDNDFKFLNNNGTQFNSRDDAVVKRLNNQFKSFNLITKFGYDFRRNKKISLYYNFLQTDKGIPGIGAFQSRHATFKTAANRFSLRLDTRRLFASRLNLSTTLRHIQKEEAFQDRRGEIGLGNKDNENRTTRDEIQLNPGILIGQHQDLKGIVQYRRERFKPFDRLQKRAVATSERETYALGIEDDITFLDDRLLLTPSLLYEVITNRFQGENFLTLLGQDTPQADRQRFLTRQIGFLYKWTDRLRIRANIGRYFRSPNFFELFGDRGGTIGSSALLSEKGFNRDVGIQYRRRFKSSLLREIALKAAYFQNDVDHLILFIQTSQRTSKPQNIGKAEVIGQELVGKISFGSHLKIAANYTHQRAVSKSEIPSQRGKILPGKPIHEFSSKTTFSLKSLSLFYRYHFTAKNFLDRVNQRVAQSRSLHNIGISFKKNAKFSITAEAKNLTDNQIEDVFGFPLPGRSYFLTMSGSI